MGCDIEVGAVLFRQSRDGQDRVGKIETFLVREHAAEDHARDEAIRLHIGDLDPEPPVIEQQAVARLDRRKNLRMAEMDAAFVARRGVGIESEDLSVLDARLTALEGTDAQFRTLEVGQNADRPVELRFDLANRAMQLFELLVGRMAHIDAKYIRTGQEQFFDHLRTGGGRPEGCDDLDATIASHCF
jgi:hypothetical protein